MPTTPDTPEIFTPTAEDMALLQGGIRRPEQTSCVNIPRSLERSVLAVLRSLDDDLFTTNFTIDLVTQRLYDLWRKQLKTGVGNESMDGIPSFVATMYAKIPWGTGAECRRGEEMDDFWLSLSNVVDIARQHAFKIKMLRRVMPEYFSEEIPLEESLDQAFDSILFQVEDSVPLVGRIDRLIGELRRLGESISAEPGDEEWTTEELIELMINSCPRLWLERQRQEIGIKLRLVGTARLASFATPFDLDALPVLQRLSGAGDDFSRFTFKWKIDGREFEQKFAVYPLREESLREGVGSMKVVDDKNVGTWHAAPDFDSATQIAVQCAPRSTFIGE